MNTQEALQLIDQAISQVATSREGHIRLQEAVNILSGLVNGASANACANKELCAEKCDQFAEPAKDTTA